MGCVMSNEAAERALSGNCHGFASFYREEWNGRLNPSLPSQRRHAERKSENLASASVLSTRKGTLESKVCAKSTIQGFAKITPIACAEKFTSYIFVYYSKFVGTSA